MWYRRQAFFCERFSLESHKQSKGRNGKAEASVFSIEMQIILAAHNTQKKQPQQPNFRGE